MTVSAHNLTLSYLCLDQFPWPALACHTCNALDFIIVHMIKLHAGGVKSALAIHARDILYLCDTQLNAMPMGLDRFGGTHVPCKNVVRDVRSFSIRPLRGALPSTTAADTLSLYWSAARSRSSVVSFMMMSRINTLPNSLLTR